MDIEAEAAMNQFATFFRPVPIAIQRSKPHSDGSSVYRITFYPPGEALYARFELVRLDELRLRELGDNNA